MILYDFKCPECGTFEAFSKSRAAFVACPQCGADSPRQVTVPRFTLDGTDPAYSTAWDRWAKDHEQRAADGERRLREHGEER